MEENTGGTNGTMAINIYKPGLRRHDDPERLVAARAQLESEEKKEVQTSDEQPLTLELKHTREGLTTILFYTTEPLRYVSQLDVRLPILTPAKVSIEGIGKIDFQDEEAFRGAVVRVPIHEDRVPTDEEPVVKMYTPLVTRGSTSWGEIVVDGVHFSAVAGKGDGSHQAFMENGSVFSRSDTRFTLTRDSDSGYASGYLTVSEAYADAETSIKRHRQGVRTRVPVAGYYINKIKLDDEEYSAQQFVDKFADGNLQEAPYVLEMAVRCPIRFSEAMDIFVEASKSGNFAGVDELILRSVSQAEQDDNNTYRELGEEWRSKVGDRTEFTAEEAYAFLLDYGRAYIQVAAEGLGRIHAHGEAHGNLHESNITFMAEIVDNVTATPLKEEKGERQMQMINEVRRLSEHIDILASAAESFRKKFFSGKKADVSSEELIQIEIDRYSQQNPGLIMQGEPLPTAWERILSSGNDV